MTKRLLSIILVFVVTFTLSNGAFGYTTTINQVEVPTVPASNIVFTNTNNTAVTINFTPGNGTGQSVFVALASITGFPQPENGKFYPTYNSFGSTNVANSVEGLYGKDQSQIGSSGWYCVNNNSTGQTPITIVGLTPGTAYRIAVVTYNGYTRYGNSGTETYLTSPGTNNPVVVTTALVATTAPTTQASGLAFTDITDHSFHINWTNGSGNKRAVFVSSTETGTPDISNGSVFTANSVYGSGTPSGNGWYCVYNGVGSTTEVSGLTAGKVYRVAIVEYNENGDARMYGSPTYGSGTTTTIDPPSLQASNISFAVVSASAITLNWTNGNGNGRAVFIAAATSGAPVPVNSTAYTGNAAFGSGSQIGSSGWICVYNGTGTGPLNVTALSPGVTYRVAVVEYNRTQGSENYVYAAPTEGVNNPINFSTSPLNIPTIQASNIVFTNTNNTAVTVDFTPGSGSGQSIFVALASVSGFPQPEYGRFYPTYNSFGSTNVANSGEGLYGKDQSQIGSSGWYCVNNNSTGQTPITIVGLTPGTAYRVAVVTYNGYTRYGNSGTETYLTSPGTNNPVVVTTALVATTAPTIQASNLTYANITGSSFDINWTNGNGNRRVVFISATESGTPSVINGSTYTANSIYGSGSVSGAGWYCVYNGTGSTAPVSGLTAGVTYKIAVVEYNENGNARMYGNAVYGAANTITISAPTLQASNITADVLSPYSVTLNWTNGNGLGRAVFISTAPNGMPVPVNNTAYVGSSAFGSGSQIGSSGWFCIYNGANAGPLTVTSLSPGLTYRVAVIEYNMTAGQQNYVYSSVLNASNNPVNFSTAPLDIPTVQASNIVFTNVNNTSATVNFTPGNGAGQSVFVALATVTGFPQPEYGRFYPTYNKYGSVNTANTGEGLYGQQGSQIGTSGWYCVNNNSTGETPVSILGLMPGTAYRVAVLTYNGYTRFGNSGRESYLSTPATNNPAILTTKKVDANFKLATTSVSCRGSNNGAIMITANEVLDYTLMLTGINLNQTVNFTSTGTIKNLSAGTYNACITVAGQPEFRQCYELKIGEPQDLAVYTSVNTTSNTLNIRLNGGARYNIDLNGQNFTTIDSVLTLPLAQGSNKVLIHTDKPCQGTFEKIINTTDNTVPYPNPFQGTLYLNLGQQQVKYAIVKIYSTTDGRLVRTETFQNHSGVLQLELSELQSGLYLLNLDLDHKKNIFKVIKQ